MHSHALSALAVLSVLLPTTLAQTHTACNPLKEGGNKCPSMEALGGSANFSFSDEMNDKVWIQQNQGKVDWSKQGTTFTIERSGDAPQVNSAFYMLFGRLEVVMRAATGRGIVSTAILQSEALDEIDWEFLGSNNTHVMTNYYGKGDNSTDVVRNAEIPMTSAPQNDFHNYTLDWTKDRLQWWLDDKMIRELKFADAKGGSRYPQTPMNVRLGAWAAGDAANNGKGVIEWAGGETDFDAGPFVMTVKSVYAQDYTTAKEYSWENMDASGDWQKVKVIEGGKSEVLEEIESPSGVRNRFNALSHGAKIGIIAGVIGFVALVAIAVFFYFIKQRRAGRREYDAQMAADNKEAAELLEYKSQMAAGRFSQQGGYNRV